MELSGSEEDFLVLSLIEKRKQKHPVHLILKTREEQGDLHLLVRELRKYRDRFQVCFRMSAVQFDPLLAIVEPHIKKKTTNLCKPIDPEQQLAVCLRQGHTEQPLKRFGRIPKNAENGSCSEKNKDEGKIYYVNMIDLT